MPILMLVLLSSSQLRADETGAPAKLVAALRQPNLTPDQRQQIANQLLDMGEEGPRALARYAGGEVEPRLLNYLAKLERAAGDTLRERIKANGGGPKVEAEIATLRQKSLGVSRSKNLTKEAIQDKCDPAIARLAELLQVTPEQAAQASSGLLPLKEEVQQNIAFYFAAMEKVPPENARGLPSLPPQDQIEQALSAREQVACQAAIPMTPQDKATLSANLPIAAKLDPAESRGIAELNRLRLLLGIGVLAIDTKLCDASRDHSKDMKQLNFFDHDSPVAGKETPWKRAAKFGTKASGENIYEGSERGESAIRTWWYSPGHHSNMMGGARRIGLGREGTFFTQMFGG